MVEVTNKHDILNIVKMNLASKIRETEDDLGAKISREKTAPALGYLFGPTGDSGIAERLLQADAPQTGQIWMK